MINDRNELENKIKAISDCINLVGTFEVKYSLEDVKKSSIEENNILLDVYIDILMQNLEVLKNKIK